MEAPSTRYARRGDADIAFQVIGDGPIDLVIVPGFISHVELFWTTPGYAEFMERLASFSRVIVFDKRGTGLSDPPAGFPTLEERMEDVRAVMDAAGSERAALLGFSEGGPMSILFAATYPERTTALVLYGTFAAFADGDDMGSFLRVETAVANWGSGSIVDVFAPSVAGGAIQHRMMGVIERASASPGMARMLVSACREIDVRDVLPSVSAPTVVLHRRDECLPISAARKMAAGIPGARMIELDGVDHVPWVGDVDTLVGHVEEFLTGTRHEPRSQRALATLLFTDIVGSTEHASRLGDGRWRDLLRDHHATVRAVLSRYGGREVNTTGDGFLAVFDGPARAIRCASAIVDAVGRLGIEVRAGVHTGECELIGQDVGGVAVHIAARVSGAAGPGEVLVSSTVKDLVLGSGLSFADRGRTVLKGVPGDWQLYLVLNTAPPVPVERHELGPADRALVGLTRKAPRVARWMSRRLTPALRQ